MNATLIDGGRPAQQLSNTDILHTEYNARHGFIGCVFMNYVVHSSIGKPYIKSYMTIEDYTQCIYKSIMLHPPHATHSTRQLL